MKAVTQARPATPGFNRVLRAFRTKNKEKNDTAVEILYRLGSPAIEFLALEAIETSIRSDHRNRLLDVILRIGGPVRALDYYRIAKGSVSL